MRDDFAVFILSHGRADNMKTVSALGRCGYTGKWYIVIDNEDKTYNRYYELFGREHVIMFDKLDVSKRVDSMDLPTRGRGVILYARNVCFEIAENLGLKYFLELDDDYTEFRMRYDKDGVFTSIFVGDLDAIFDEVLEFLDVSKASTVALSQMGDFIGGKNSSVYKYKLTRKAMNAFFCTTERPFKWFGRINEDVNTYTTLGSRGKLFFTLRDISLNQQDTQQNSGGMTESYLDAGTYIKSFYTVMAMPSAVKIAEMNCSHKRIHHFVDWEHCVPQIVSSRFKK